MTASKTRSERRKRGQIETLPSGSLRVSVYAGVDQLTGQRNYLKELVPHGTPNAEREAEKVLTRLLNQVDEQRNPRTKVNVDTLMGRYLDGLNVDKSTLIGYQRLIRNHIRPLLGGLQVAKLDGETIESFYSILKQCSAHCGGKGKFIEHRKKGEHECTDKCKPHECKGLSASTIRKVHACLSGALAMAMRWRWISVNPLDQAKQPAAPKAKPNPPSPEQAAVIVNDAFQDLPWGMLVWLAMTTGARRGELCGLRLNQLHLDKALLEVKTSIGQEGADTWEKDTKDHQQRRIALDETTVSLLRIYLQQCESVAAEMGRKVNPKGYLFSTSIDHSAYLKPDSVSQRYSRMCKRLGIESHLHELRHYSATELISAGVDPRTVAGRLGHGGGGATTLRVYTAWLSEADQRAAGTLSGRMPAAPIVVDESGRTVTRLEPKITGPYQKIAADLRGAIACGALRPGDMLPTVVELKARYGVSVGTANRAVAELKAEGLVSASRGKRAVVLDPTKPIPDHSAEVVELHADRKAK
ncbi:site-specific recombinase XerD [Saccharothrix saharensis]|uniref:Site-specific recombinase XerD n=1 Tax=Saccharothrix saharensis TaxID=571190 RepID=A0A543JD09_9PSEU|nr:tyrosine-type recombinase/integrase [Saccharothrix saharensis]TQM80661.1 site-specific recombinase XerD [Saccharothrix saharensis]